MRNGFFTILGALAFALIAPGCMAMKATTETVKHAGKSTVAVVKTTTKAATWPVRRSMTAKKRKAQESEGVPPMVVSHAASTREKRKKAVDGDVVLASTTEDDRGAPPEDADEPPIPRKSRRRQASKPPEDVKLADVDGEMKKDFDPAPEPEAEIATPRTRAGWKSKGSPARTASYDSDPDTIRID